MATSTSISTVGDNLSGFQVSLDVVGANPAEFSGGTGSIAFGARDLNLPQILRNQRATLTDDSAGSFIGRISQITADFASGTSFTMETMLERLAVESTIVPSRQTMAAGMNRVLGQVGMSATGLPATQVTFPGWEGSFLDYVKMFCIAHSYEFLPHETDPNIVVFRAWRANTFNPTLSGISTQVSDSVLAQNIEIVNYSYAEMNDAVNVEFTPAFTDNPQILTVDAGQTAEYEIQFNGWAASVNQPVAYDLVSPAERTDAGAYCVAGSDGLPITAAQWNAQGGLVKVFLTPNPSVLRVVVTAPAASSLRGVSGEDRFAPYSIAASSGDGTLYNSLHITGKGVRTIPTNLRIPTGVPLSTTTEEVGASIENPWVNGLDKAFSLGSRAAQAYAGPVYTISVATSPTHNLRTVVGARYEGGLVKFRVTTGTTTESDLRGEGVMDTLFSDFNTSSTGMTFNQWATANTGLTFDQWATVPLKVS